MPSSHLPPPPLPPTAVHSSYLQTLSPSSNSWRSGCGGVGASPHQPTVIQAAAEDALAGGPDQWAADSAHKAEAVRKGERDLWRIQSKTSLRVSSSQLWRSVVPASGGRLFSQTVPIELLEGREVCFFLFFFLMNERIAVRCAALNSTCCTSTFTSDPPLFYQRSCKARLKVHSERRFPSFTSLSPSQSLYNCNEAETENLYLFTLMFSLLSAAIFPLICVAPTLFWTVGRNGSMRTFHTDVIPEKYSDTDADEFNSSSADVFGLAVSH